MSDISLIKPHPIHILSFLYQAAFCLFLNSLSLYLLQTGMKLNVLLSVGVSFILSAAMTGVVVGFLVNRWVSYLQLALIGLATGVVAMLLMSYPNNDFRNVALSLFAMASGCYTAQVAVLLNHQYLKTNQRQKSQEINYLFANIGSVLGFASIALVHWFVGGVNYRLMHLVSAALLVIALVLLFSYRNRLEKPAQFELNLLNSLKLIFVLVLLFSLCFFAMKERQFSVDLAALLLFFVLFYLVLNAVLKKSSGYLKILFVLVFAGGTFWLNVALFHFFDPVFVRYDLPAHWLPALLMVLNPIAIIAFALLHALWRDRFINQSFQKLVFGLVLSLMAYGFLILSLWNLTNSYWSFIFILINIVIVAIAEYVLSPTLNVLVNQLLPQKYDAIMMALLRLVRGATFVFLYGVMSRLFWSASHQANNPLMAYGLFFFAALSLVLFMIVGDKKRRV